LVKGRLQKPQSRKYFVRGAQFWAIFIRFVLNNGKGAVPPSPLNEQFVDNKLTEKVTGKVPPTP
jgi:hypothetical protein